MSSYDGMSLQHVSKLPRNEKRPRFACFCLLVCLTLWSPRWQCFPAEAPPSPQPTTTLRPPSMRMKNLGSQAAITYIISPAYMQISARGAVICLIVMWPLLTICLYTLTKVYTAPGGKQSFSRLRFKYTNANSSCRLVIYSQQKETLFRTVKNVKLQLISSELKVENNKQNGAINSFNYITDLKHI